MSHVLYVYRTYWTTIIFCYDLISGGKCKVHLIWEHIHTQNQHVDSVLQIKCKNLSCVSGFVVHLKEKKLTHSCFSKEETSPFCVFVCTALIVLFPIKQHQSLGTAGPATGRTINSLCQAPSQMVLTLSWRVWTISIKQHHLFKMLDEEPWQTLCVSIRPSSIPWGGSHPGIKCSEKPDPSKD